LAGLCCLLPLAVGFHRAAASADDVRPKNPGESAKNNRAVEQAELVPAGLGLKVGERLLYDIRVNGIPAGKALLKIRSIEAVDGDKGPQVWVAELHTRSTRAASLLYDVNDSARSRIDVKGGFSRFFNIERHEGDVRAEERITFGYDIGSMEAVCDRPRNDSQRRTHTIPLTGKALDPLAAIYYLRAISLRNLQPGNTIRLPICADRRLWNTVVRVVAPKPGEDVGCPQGRQYVAVEPDAEFRGLFERKGGMRILLDAETGVPLKMFVELPIGPAEVTLTESVGSPLPDKKP
jgi:hypothetical protein